MKKWSILLLISAFTIILAACNAGEKNGQSGSEADSKDMVTINHEYGETPVKKNPENVVVFDFGVLDTLDELGIEVVGLPKATIPNYLEKFSDDKYTNVGSLKEPDFEAIHAL